MYKERLWARQTHSWGQPSAGSKRVGRSFWWCHFWPLEHTPQRLFNTRKCNEDFSNLLKTIYYTKVGFPFCSPSLFIWRFPLCALLTGGGDWRKNQDTDIGRLRSTLEWPRRAISTSKVYFCVYRWWIFSGECGSIREIMSANSSHWMEECIKILHFWILVDFLQYMVH